MSAADQSLAGGASERAFVGARDARCGERIADPTCPRRPTFSNGGKTIDERGAGPIDAKGEHMQGDVAPAHRKLGTVDQADPGLGRSFVRLGKSGNLVVIGERQDVHSTLCRPADERSRREEPV